MGDRMTDRDSRDDEKVTESSETPTPRREFLTAAAALAGTALAAGEAAAQMPEYRPNEPQLNVPPRLNVPRPTDNQLRASTAEFIATNNVNDLRGVRLPGATKPFEQMTISELTQLRPGVDARASYNIEAVTTDVTISTSSILANIARARGLQGVRTEASRLGPQARVRIEGM
jgi:hypothetical protein